MRALLLALFLTGCPGTEDDLKDTGTGDTGDSGGGDTETDVPDADRDGDGFPASVDCDDTRASVNPDVAADICNGLDDDCDQSVDEDPDLTWYPDADFDGFGEAGSGGSEACTFDAPDGEAWATNDADCNDEDANTFPGAQELCGGGDNDCDGETDEDPSSWLTFYADADGDGAGDPNNYVLGCDALSAGGADNAWDCDDRLASEPVFADANSATRGTGDLASPYRSLQSAIAEATSCVVAFDGTYYEDVDFLGKSLHVWAPDGADVTSIEGTGNEPVVTVASGETAAKLEGFSIGGGGGLYQASSSSYYDSSTGTYYTYYYDYYYGGGLYVVGSELTLVDAILTDNVLPEQSTTWTSTTSYEAVYSYGGGAYVNGGTLTLERVDLKGNAAGWGGALHADYGTVLANGVRIVGNAADYFVVSQYGGTVALDGALVSSNKGWSSSGYDGFYLGSYGMLGLRNTTIVGHQMATYLTEGTVELASSIVHANGYGIYDAGGSTTVTATYSDVNGNGMDWYNETEPTGNGNIDQDPMFVSFSDDDEWTNDDLTLAAGSPAIDAGDPANFSDRDGSRTDMGAYGGPNALDR